MTTLLSFINEEVESTSGYISSYKPKTIADQLETLHKLFPELSTADEAITSQELPRHAEGWFAIPRWEKIADTYDAYSGAVQKVFNVIGQNHKFHNWIEYVKNPDKNDLRIKNLSQVSKTADAFQKFGNEQKDHDILVIPAQFGFRHRGRSARRAREVFTENEFDLGAFEVGIMILTHPERLKNHKVLCIICAGAEFVPDYVGEFLRLGTVPFIGGRIEFCCRSVEDASEYYGSASGFVPQS